MSLHYHSALTGCLCISPLGQALPENEKYDLHIFVLKNIAPGDGGGNKQTSNKLMNPVGSGPSQNLRKHDTVHKGKINLPEVISLINNLSY